ncbi:hypothetical protein HRG_007573 [Hirsutella rhossiliensis]|uniref:Uncharacterized protein n=1 Tax=Hirsutella rhossiliensis TaxID=111463 RepID=A0A9P8MUI9_9HYPO|nr:uncharacterized protein HRG_07573 [Hirsutella rhossiliensis]KAH0961495.1 hypothetical protein HRG_07573 [Hirsutella rhossiliensis]
MDQSFRFAASADTTYHSFNDIELLEPPSVPSPPDSRGSSSSFSPASLADHHGGTPQQVTERGGKLPLMPTAAKMQRQDSGYESYGATPRPSVSQVRPPAPARPMSNTSSAGMGSPSRLRTRPSTRRSAKSFPQPSCPPSLLYHTPRPHASRPPSAAYFQFPSPDLLELTETSSTSHRHQEHAPATYQPPQTTHYWTSDRTRRLEYAAIDAAGRGVKGWVRRNLVPGCFGPRHVAFDDDTGSVRRYRLELEDDHDEKSPGPSPGRRRKGWQFWPLLRRSKTL